MIFLIKINFTYLILTYLLNYLQLLYYNKKVTYDEISMHFGNRE